MSLAFRLSLFLVAAFFVGPGCVMRPQADEPATAESVWRFISEEAPKHDLSPAFVYAIANAESSLDPNADSGVARGMMQLKEVAWSEVTDKSYRHVWNWKTNIEIGMRYLVHLRTGLENNGAFSYPLLAAAYRYGPGTVRNANYQLENLGKQPTNHIYIKLLEGNVSPVPPPMGH